MAALSDLLLLAIGCTKLAESCQTATRVHWLTSANLHKPLPPLAIPKLQAGLPRKVEDVDLGRDGCRCVI